MGGNYSYFTEVLHTLRDANATCSMGDLNNDFMKYENLNHLFGYSRGPVIVQNNIDLNALFKQNSIFHKGQLYIDLSIYAKTNVNSLQEFSNLNVTKRILKPEVWHDVIALKEKVLNFEYDTATLKHRKNIPSEANNELMPNFIKIYVQDLPQKIKLEGSNIEFDYTDENFVDIVNIVERMEFFGRIKSNSLAEFYYKLNLRNGVILKNDAEDFVNSLKDFAIYEDLKKKNQYLDFLVVLYKGHLDFEQLFKDIPLAGIKHYTPKEFAILSANFSLNTAYELVSNGPRVDEICNIMGFTGIDKQNVLQISKEFLENCHGVEYLEKYIKEHPDLYKNFSKEDLDNVIIDKRKNLIYRYIGQFFGYDLKLMMDKLYAKK